MGKDLTEALRQMTEGGLGQTSRVDKVLPAASAAPAIPPRSGSSGPKAGASGGSIASPLTEIAYANRTYHSPKTITSTDGLITWQVDPIKDVFFNDANNSPVQVIYQSP